ncbi:FAD-dependent oxidoreductase [Brachybacterium sp. JHP9]|uniref:FAD-dependent oxidoreductase n=1 Tax=Brachybacterium equifaecis TaxID=2910770 RepID=A0ABT0QZA8_9MICO|nr:FAD-dependent oxidoreductase [Brachybacterium equifaecis]MCL6422513.1 FAD-dependent oxidoreductase [Brachybacterium equifaecis]
MSAGLRPRDRRAVLHRGPVGEGTATGRSVAVIGGGIAGLSAATVLAEHGAHVRVLEREETWGGRARSWELPGGRSMSRGFHAFFRQYYTLRGLLRRADPSLSGLRSIGDYPLQLADGPRDTFTGIPRTPPFSVAAFALRSRSFPLRQLARVDIPAALGLLQTRFPGTFSALDGRSAQELLDSLRFPDDARHLALEVFARSFFADPREFSAGELVAMFHAYFMGSAEGLIFDVPADSYSPALWDPLAARIARLGGVVTTGADVEELRFDGSDGEVAVDLGAGAGTGARRGGDAVRVDAVVLAADPRSARRLVAGAVHPEGAQWEAFRGRVAAQRNAPPFAVLRLWLDRHASAAAPAFLGTSGFGPLDNVSFVERFEQTARDWSAQHGGSVVELHAYAIDPAGDPAALKAELVRQLHRLHPELRGARALHEEWLVHDDCPLIGLAPWAERPTVPTPDPRLVLAGDWLRTDEPVALMERAALTGVRAANALLDGWGSSGEDTWTVPMRGVLTSPWTRTAG